MFGFGVRFFFQCWIAWHYPPSLSLSLNIGGLTTTPSLLSCRPLSCVCQYEKTALMIACSDGHTAIAVALAKLGADKDFKNTVT